jgi:chemotaxis protein CheZ
VEDNLVSLVVMAGHVDQLTGTVHQIENNQPSAELGVGPQIMPEQRKDVLSGQDDVDDLLSSLGF